MNGITLIEYWNMELTIYLVLGGGILANLVYIYHYLKAYRRLVLRR